MTFNDKILFSMFFLFAIGVSCGAFFEVYMDAESKENLTQTLSLLFTQGSSSGFFQNIYKGLLNWFLILFIPFATLYLPPLAVFCPFIPFAKGLSIGFSGTVLVESFNLKGGFYIAATLLPQSLIQIPVMCFLITMSVASLQKSNKKALYQDTRQYYICYAAGAGLIVISCLIEALLMKLIL